MDDHPANVLAVETVLQELSCEVVRALSGAEALRALLSTDFSLVLLDVQMPGVDGFQVARLVRERERSRHTPIIFVTAHSADDEQVMKAYSLGAVDFLFKPIVPEVLRAKATVFLELWRRSEEITSQAELLREHERREHSEQLEKARQEWERRAMQQQMVRQQHTADELSRKAEELARTVAEKEHAERELKQKNEQLAESDQRKDEFIAVLAHELRNPLAPIKTGLELIRTLCPDETSSTQAFRRATQAMDRQLSHLGRLVDDLLDVSRINSGKVQLQKSQVSLRELLQQAVSTCGTLADEKGHKISVELPEHEDVVLNVDSVRMTQVVANLLSNAIRYTASGGKIRIWTEVNEQTVAILVRDNGQGISADMLGQIFDMFVQNQAPGSGLGIGLALVQRLVRMHDGEVCARSNGANQGSEFEVRLPRERVSEPPVSPALEVAPKKQAARHLRIVLIDDDQDIRDTTAELLTLWGHFVITADSGPVGIEMIRAERPDVALVDIGMPSMDGFEVAETVTRELSTEKPYLIAITGYGRKQDRERVFASGFDSHLVKPVSAETLEEALQGISSSVVTQRSE